MSQINAKTCCEQDAPIVHTLFTIHHLLMRVGDRLTAPHGLTGSRWMLLCALDRQGDSATVSSLADEQMMSVQAISRMLVTMENEGLINKVNRPGCGRTVFVSLTERGREAVSVLQGLGEAFGVEFLAGLDQPRIDRLQADLQSILENLRRYENDMIASRSESAPASEKECV